MVIHWNISIYLCKGILYKIHFLTKNVLKNVIEYFIYISFSLIDEPTLWVSILHKFFLSVGQSFQSLSCVQLFVTQWIAACQTSLSISNSRSLFKLMSIESVIPSNHLICCPLLLPPSIFPSIRVFANESVFCIRKPKYWSYALASVLPMNIQDWFPLG